MRNKKLLFLLPALGLVLTGCSLNGVIKKGKDILRPAKHWVGETLYWPTRDEIMGSESYKEEPKEETKAEETPAEVTPAQETPAQETPTEETPAQETPTEETPSETSERVEIVNLNEKRTAYNKIITMRSAYDSLPNYTCDCYVNDSLVYSEMWDYPRAITIGTRAGNQFETIEYIEYYENYIYQFIGDGNGGLKLYHVYVLSEEEIKDYDDYSEESVISDEELEKLQMYREGNTYFIRRPVEYYYELLTSEYPENTEYIDAFFAEIDEFPFEEYTLIGDYVTQIVLPDFYSTYTVDGESGTSVFEFEMVMDKLVYHDVDSTIVERPEGIEFPPVID